MPVVPDEGFAQRVGLDAFERADAGGGDQDDVAQFVLAQRQRRFDSLDALDEFTDEDGVAGFHQSRGLIGRGEFLTVHFLSAAGHCCLAK